MFLPSTIHILILTVCISATRKLDKVLVLGLDGFGGNYVKNASEAAPEMHSVFKKSLVSFNMRAQFPVWSAPNWAALFTGLSTTESGIEDNNWNHTNHSEPICPISGCQNPLETFLDVAHSQNAAASGVIVSSWPWISGFALNRSFIEAPLCEEYDDACVEHHVIEALKASSKKNSTKLIFSVFEAIDHAGHTTFWGSPEYYAAVSETDERVKRILEYVDQQTLVVITADHGGLGDGHGDFHRYDLESFVAYYVKDCLELLKTELPFAGSNVKVAPTILHALGYRRGNFMSAEPLTLFHDADNFSLPEIIIA